MTFIVLRRTVIQPLQHAAQRIEQIAAGDLTMQDEPTGRSEIGRLSRHLQQMQRSLVQTVGSVRQGAEEIYAGTSEISAGNSDLSTRTEGTGGGDRTDGGQHGRVDRDGEAKRR